MALQTFAMPKDTHGFVFDCMRLVNKIAQRGQWQVSALHQIMTLIEQTAHDTALMTNAIIVFQQALTM
jgi:hypothetical protein